MSSSMFPKIPNKLKWRESMENTSEVMELVAVTMQMHLGKENARPLVEKIYEAIGMIDAVKDKLSLLHLGLQLNWDGLSLSGKDKKDEGAA